MPEHTILIIAAFIKDWVWIPFVTIISSAIGLHLKAEHAHRKDTSARMDKQDAKIDKAHQRITENHEHVLSNYVKDKDLDEVKQTIARIDENITWLTRQQGKKD